MDIKSVIRDYLGCIHYVLPGGGGGEGGRGFFGGYKNFQDEIGGIVNFQLIYRGDVKFPLDPY